MPDLNKIRLFEKKIQSLAGEPEYLAEKGETLHSVADTKKDDPSADLSDLFDEDVSGAENNKKDSLKDIFSGMDDLLSPDDFATSLDTIEEQDDSEDVDLSDLFGSEDESFEETSLTDSEDSSGEDGDDLSDLFGSEDESFEETSLTDSEDSSPEDGDDLSALFGSEDESFEE
ncbi:MAG: hypothetical protein JXR63_12595, partial [Spirochaetales bacterium]|nr:hypothetical protein [Spirochaetales bacterium]